MGIERRGEKWGGAERFGLQPTLRKPKTLHVHGETPRPTPCPKRSLPTRASHSKPELEEESSREGGREGE